MPSLLKLLSLLLFRCYSHTYLVLILVFGSYSHLIKSILWYAGIQFKHHDIVFCSGFQLRLLKKEEWRVNLGTSLSHRCCWTLSVTSCVLIDYNPCWNDATQLRGSYGLFRATNGGDLLNVKSWRNGNTATWFFHYERFSRSVERLIYSPMKWLLQVSGSGVELVALRSHFIYTETSIYVNSLFSTTYFVIIYELRKSLAKVDQKCHLR